MIRIGTYEMYALKAISTAAFFICFESDSVFSADFYSTKSEDSSSVLLYGDIASGDSVRLRELINQENRSGRIVYSITLMSRGGVVDEGIALGNVIRNSRLNAVAPSSFDNKYFVCMWGDLSQSVDRWDIRTSNDDENCICASACAVAWLGGVSRNGIVGFHRSYLGGDAPTEGYKYTDDHLSDSYSKIAEYLKSVRSPNWLSDRIFSTASNEISWVNADEQNDLSLDPTYEEYILSKCGVSPDGEKREVVEMSLLAQSGGLSYEETKRVEELSAIVDSYNKCNFEASLDAKREAQL